MSNKFSVGILKCQIANFERTFYHTRVHIGDKQINILLYADDIILLAENENLGELFILSAEAVWKISKKKSTVPTLLYSSETVENSPQNTSLRLINKFYLRYHNIDIWGCTLGNF